MNHPDLDLVALIRERYARALETIAEASRRAGRSPDSVRLVVVSKAQPLNVVQAAIDAGVHILGENYAAEAVAKMAALQIPLSAVPSKLAQKQAATDTRGGVEWHMIGHVQGRKARLVAQYFDLVHSVDSLKLAERLDRLAAELGRQIPVLLEFNVGGEPEKHGWAASEESGWPRLVEEIEAAVRYAHIRVNGLMTMPPLTNDPEQARPYFRRLRRLQEFLAARIPETAWQELSMGTSADYGVAVEEGATLVRVGQAILGARP